MVSGPHRPPPDEAARRAQLLERLLVVHRARLLRQVRRHSQRPDDADDALADACVQFLRFYAGPSTDDDCLRWMLAVAKRCAWEIDRRRRERDNLASLLPLDDAGVEVPTEFADAAELVERREEVEEVMEALDGLAPDERTTLILFGLGFSYAEIAALCGWSYGKVHRGLAEGRARVRRQLEGGDSS